MKSRKSLKTCAVIAQGEPTLRGLTGRGSSLRQKLRQAQLHALRAAQIHSLLGERLVEAACAQAEGVALGAVRATTRQKKRVAAARQLGMYLAHTLFSASLTRTGRLFGRDRTTARHACACIEEARDDVRIARRLAHLEPALQYWAQRFTQIIIEAEDAVVDPALLRESKA